MKRFLIVCIAGVLSANVPLDSATNVSADSHLDSTANTNVHIDLTDMILPPPERSSQKTSYLGESNFSFLHNIRFDFLLDNTEDCDWLWTPRTISAVSLEPEIGLGIGEFHALWVGGYGIQNMGAKPIAKGAKGGIYAYYAFSQSGFSALLGIAPRKKLILRYPRTFFRNDFEFMNPNINGVIFQYQSTQDTTIKGQGELVLNHFGGNLANATDMFYASLGGKITFFDSLILGADAMLYHIQDTNLLRKNAENNDTFLFERILYDASIAWDLRGFDQVSDIFEVANVGFALLGEAERKKAHSGYGGFSNNIGYEISANLQYKGFGIEESYYFGKPQMHYFMAFGEDIYNGLPFYQTNFNRINAYYTYKNDFAKISFNFVFYVIGKRLSTQQMLVFSFDSEKLW